MTELKGTNVAAPVVPFTSDDKYATHDAAYGKGGFRSVGTIAERDAIPADRKTEGMVVRVQVDKKHYVWESNAWAEWLPKGNVTVDTALNVNSNNAVSNKAVTTGINTLTTAVDAVRTVANAAIPKTDIVQAITQPTNASNVPSTKATFDFVTGISADINAQIASVRNTANAAIPKSKIAAESGNIVSSDTTQVPSSKAISTLFTDVTELFNDGLDNVNEKATNALNAANAAIPRANITQAVAGNTTRQDLVPSAKAVNDAITSAVNNVPKITVDSALSTTSVNPVQNKVVTAKFTDVTTGMQLLRDDINATIEDLGNVSSDVTTNHNDITDINTKLTPIKSAWDKKNAANGLVVLDSGAKLPANVLPAGYDNIDKLVAFVTANPSSGMTIGQKWYNTATKKIFTATSATSGAISDPIGDDMIYINQNENKSYYWSGSAMVNIGSGNALALGTTHSTAFYGDYGNTLYTNFVSGNNLANTQKARDFFSINSDSEYIGNPYIGNRTMDNMDIIYKKNSFGIASPVTTSLNLPIVDSTHAGIMSAEIYKTLQELELQAFPLEVRASIAGAGTYEVGVTTKDAIRLYVQRKGVDVNADATITLKSSGGSTVDGSLNAAKTMWTPNTNITQYAAKTFHVTYGTQSKDVTASWLFKYKKYWGVSDKATLTNADVLAMAGSTWADSRTMGATRFDCTGGKYPYYIIPASLYTGLEMWVGGLKNTDLVVTDMQVTNASGATSAYKVIRLNNKQTGVLSVEFK